MKANELRAFLMPWLESFVQEHPFVTGAYLAGSTAELAPEADLAGCSDIDIMLTIDDEPRLKPGKIPCGGYVIEGTYISKSSIADPQAALADYHIAHGLHHGHILLDRDGRLGMLCAAVAAEFALPQRIEQRIESTLAKIEGNLRGYDCSLPLCNRMMGLCFSAGILCHSVLVAGQKNPTVRMRYQATQRLLAARPEGQELLLRTAGFADITPQEARAFVLEMAALFDLVSPRCKTAFPFTGDLLPDMRKSAVDDSLALIEKGLHRETMFWTCATFARLMAQARADLPELYAEWMPTLEHLAGRIGLDSVQAEQARIAGIRATFAPVRALCAEIIREGQA